MFSWSSALIVLAIAAVVAGGSVVLASTLISKGKCLYVTTSNIESCTGYITK